MKPNKMSKMPVAHKVKTRKCTFLTFPGELRNSIYAFYYESVWVIELMPKCANYTVSDAHKISMNDFVREENDYPLLLRCGKPLGKYNHVEGLKTRWQFSASALHLANKQISRECMSFLYGNITVFAQSSNRLDNFLAVVPKQNLEYITRLNLDHQTYGEAKDISQVAWKPKHDGKWDRTCRGAVMQLPNIQELQINLDVRDVPLRFSFKEPWVKSLLRFRHLQSLKHVSVCIITPEISNTWVNVWSGRQWGRYQPWYVRMLCEQHHGVVEMHKLFGQAVSLKILGAPDDIALAEYKTACNGKFKEWIHYHPSSFEDD